MSPVCLTCLDLTHNAETNRQREACVHLTPFRIDAEIRGHLSCFIMYIEYIVTNSKNQQTQTYAVFNTAI